MVGVLSIVFIVWMWAKKDIATIYSTMPKEQIVPLIATSVAVTLIKAVLLAAAVLLIKWIAGKFKKK